MTGIDVTALQARLREFAQAREWERFHNPKNLAMALSVEVAELVEIYQWLTPEEAASTTSDGEITAAIGEELADIVLYLTRLADIAGVDLAAAVEAKLAKNEVRYPPRGGYQ